MLEIVQKLLYTETITLLSYPFGKDNSIWWQFGRKGRTGVMRQLTDKGIRTRAADDERQFMLDDTYEVYEKQGAPVGAMAFHYHNFYEIIYVCEGEYSSLIENRIYHLRKGDFLLIDQNIRHKYHYIEKKHDNSKRIILWITEAMLNQLAQGAGDLAACFREQESCAYHFPVYYEEMLRGYLLKVAQTERQESRKEVSGEIRIKKVLDVGYLTLFFGYLNALCRRREYFTMGEEMVLHPMVEQVSGFMEEHITEKLTVEMLADHVHMSKYHFLRTFKELTGVTVHTYLTDMRLIRACEELKSGSSIEMAYQRAGFADYSSFLRNFKSAYGVSPRRYREFYPD